MRPVLVFQSAQHLVEGPIESLHWIPPGVIGGSPDLLNASDGAQFSYGARFGSQNRDCVLGWNGLSAPIYPGVAPIRLY